MFLLVRILRTLELEAEKLRIPYSAVSLIFDDGESASRLLGTFKELKRSVKVIDEKIAAIAFADDRFYQPLQAADLFACLLAKEERRITHNEQQIYGSLGDLLDTTGVGKRSSYVGGRFDRNVLEENGDKIYLGMQKFYR